MRKVPMLKKVPVNSDKKKVFAIQGFISLKELEVTEEVIKNVVKLMLSGN